MTEYQENQEEKAELYVDHYTEIAEAKQAFEQQWEDFTESWGTDLAQTLESGTIIEDPDVPDQFVAVELPFDDAERRQWVFRQGPLDWSYIFPPEWWLKLDEQRTIYSTTEPSGRVGFLHRLDSNQEKAIKDHELVFYLRNSPDNDKFYDGFASRFNADDEIPNLLPSGTTRPGRKSNVIEATYDIEVEFHHSFFDAYISALARAVDDHIVSNSDLIKKIDALQSKTLEEDISF